MANMSYCRFHNTAMDLDDCLEALEWEDDEKLSDFEWRAANRMFRRFLDFMVDRDIIEEFDEERLGEYLNRFKDEDDSELIDYIESVEKSFQK